MLPIINRRQCHFGIEKHLLCEIWDGFESSTSSNAKLMAKNKTHHEINDEKFVIEDEMDELFDQKINEMFGSDCSEEITVHQTPEVNEDSYYTETATMDEDYQASTYEHTPTNKPNIGFFQKLTNFVSGGTIGAGLFFLSFSYIMPFSSHLFNLSHSYTAQGIANDPSFARIVNSFGIATFAYFVQIVFVGSVWLTSGARKFKDYSEGDQKALKLLMTIPTSVISTIFLFFVLKESFSMAYLLKLMEISGLYFLSIIGFILGAIALATPFLGAFYFKGFKSLKAPSFISKIKNKLFKKKGKIEIQKENQNQIHKNTPLYQLEDFSELFDDIRHKVSILETNYQSNMNMISYFHDMKSSIEQLQISLHILLQAHDINAQQDAKTMIEIALPNMFEAYFNSLEKVNQDEAQNNTLLFLNTLVRLEEKFCLLAKDVVEFEKNQKNLSLNEALQFAESRFLQQEQTHHKNLNSSL